MRVFNKKVAATLVAGGLVFPAGLVSVGAQADDEERFAESQYRHDVMEHFSLAIGKIIQNFQGNVQHPSHFAPAAAIMAEAAKMTTDAFEKDTRGMEGFTKAKDSVWENWEDFSARLKKMEDDTAAFAEVAATGDMEAIGPAFRRAVSQCKGCHDEYKAD